MNVATRASDPLLAGFYTASEAARLLRINSKQRIYRWLGTGKDAVIWRDYEPVGGSQELSFWDLFEVRFVEHFRAQGLSLQYLRKVAIRAREEFDTRHPFALYNAKFVTDRKWPAAGSKDTELGVLMEPEVDHGTTEVYARVQT